MNINNNVDILKDASSHAKINQNVANYILKAKAKVL